MYGEGVNSHIPGCTEEGVLGKYEERLPVSKMGIEERGRKSNLERENVCNTVKEKQVSIVFINSDIEEKKDE